MASPETTAQILNAAGEVFAEKGFKQATIREICGKAGVNVASVNYHFGDKERLYIEAVKNARNALEAEVPLPENLASEEPEQALRVFIHTMARRILNRNVESWRHVLLVREFIQPTRACQEMLQESIVPFVDQLHAVIRKLLPPDVPQHTIRQLGFSIISQCAYYRLQDRVVSMLTPDEEFQQHFTPDILADHIARFSMAAIRAYDSIDSFSET